MSDKIFINGLFILEHAFNDGGKVLNISIPANKIDGLCAQLNQLKPVEPDGWLKLRIGRNRQPTMSKKDPSKVIATHSMTVDTWKPSSAPQQQSQPDTRQADPSEPNDDNVPF